MNRERNKNAIIVLDFVFQLPLFKRHMAAARAVATLELTLVVSEYVLPRQYHVVVASSNSLAHTRVM